MTEISILFGIFIFLCLALISVFIYQKWRVFKNLQPGDACCRWVNCGVTSEIVMDEIIQVDIDEVGYTKKVYTKNNSYTFFDFLRYNILTVYD